MDIQLTFIILIFGTLIVMEYFDKQSKKIENFAVVRPGYTNISPFLDLRYQPVEYSVNIGKKKRGFLNFGTFGNYPPNPLCASCYSMTGNSVNPPYLRINDLGDESGDLYGKVANQCQTIKNKNYDNFSKPFVVEGRTAGRPRQCRKLL